MKIGLRTPSLEKSFKARTTGRLKRQMKKSVNPLYGKKGMGLINNPKKAIYNKIYSKKSTSENVQTYDIPGNDEAEYAIYHINYTGNKWVYIALAVLFGIFGIQFFYTGETSKGIKCFLFFWTGIPYFYSLYMAVVALFKPVNEKGEITFQSKPKVMRIS